MRYILTLPTLLALLCGCISNGSDAVGPSPHGAVPDDGQDERDGKRYSIHGKKDIIDDVTGKVVESYDLQLDFDRDINEIVRQANNRANLGKKVKCHIRLKHSELSDVLDKIISVPCTLTCRRGTAFGMSDSTESIDEICETWGYGEVRLLSVRKRFDLTFTFSICCLDSKEASEKVLARGNELAKLCRDFSVSNDVLFNVMVQSDYYVSLDIIVVTYKDKQE